MNITQEQIDRINVDFESGNFDTDKQEEDIRALLSAYEERGREVERLQNNLIAEEQIVLIRNKDLLKAQAEIERLRKLNDEQRISDAKTYTEIIKRKEGEVERLRAECEQLKADARFMAFNSERALAQRVEEAEIRLREVVGAVSIPLMTSEAKRLRDRVLAAAQPEEEP